MVKTLRIKLVGALKNAPVVDCVFCFCFESTRKQMMHQAVMLDHPNGGLSGHPNTAMWIRIMQAIALFSVHFCHDLIVFTACCSQNPTQHSRLLRSPHFEIKT
jgi:hypothetical protein